MRTQRLFSVALPLALFLCLLGVLSGCANRQLDREGGVLFVLELGVDQTLLGTTLEVARSIEAAAHEAGLDGIVMSVTGNQIDLSGEPVQVVRQGIVAALEPGMVVEEGEGRLLVRWSDSARAAMQEVALEQTINLLHSRLDGIGVTAANRMIVADEREADMYRLVVVVGGETDGKVRSILVRRGRMEIVPVIAGPAPSPEELAAEQSELRITPGVNTDPLEYYGLDTTAVLAGSVVRWARAARDEYNQPAIIFQLHEDAAEVFSQYTLEHIGTRVAIVIDDQVYSAPTISVQIPSGHARMTGPLSNEEAKELALTLRVGALPAPLTVLEERAVPPRSRWTQEQRQQPWLVPMT